MLHFWSLCLSHLLLLPLSLSFIYIYIYIYIYTLLFLSVHEFVYDQNDEFWVVNGEHWFLRTLFGNNPRIKSDVFNANICQKEVDNLFSFILIKSCLMAARVNFPTVGYWPCQEVLPNNKLSGMRCSTISLYLSCSNLRLWQRVLMCMCRGTYKSESNCSLLHEHVYNRASFTEEDTLKEIQFNVEGLIHQQSININWKTFD